MDGRVVDQGPGPKSDAQDESEGQVEKKHSGFQPVEVSNPSDDGRHDRATDDPSGENASERSVMFGDRIERQRNEDRPHHGGEEANRWKRDCGDLRGCEKCEAQAHEGAGSGSYQDPSAIEELQQKRTYDTTRGHQAPEPGDGGSAGLVRI